MSDANQTGGRRPARLPLALVQREIVLLLALAAVSAVLFGATRELAAWTARINRDKAAEWYSRGDAMLDAGTAVDAVAPLRRAAAADRSNRQYALGLARALDEAGRPTEARRLLEQLRERYPDNVEINYRLARSHAAAGEAPDAVRYYNHAMYGLASFGIAYERWRIRVELIRFLLDRDETGAALAELGALSRELPDTVDAHLTAARLCADAGDHRRALTHFERVREHDPKRADAAAGAGDAAYALGDYGAALQHWAAAEKLGADLALRDNQRRTARAIVARDPLARGVSRAERGRRVVAGLTWARARLNGCAAAAAPSDAQAPAAVSLPDAVDALRLRPASAFTDPDLMSEALSVILRVATAAAARCPSTDPVDQAWLLIARRAAE